MTKHRAADLPPVETEELKTAAKEYGEYLCLAGLAENQMNDLTGAVETTLMRVDEYGSLIDSIRGDREKLFQKITPPLVEKARELQRVYQLIDQLEGFIKNVGRSVRQMEEQVTVSTQAYNLVQRHKTINSFGLGSLSSKYIPVKTLSSMPEYTGLNIVDSKEFFHNWRENAFEDKLYEFTGGKQKKEERKD